MRTALEARLTYRGRTLDTSPTRLGALRDSRDILDDPAALRRRAEEDGYLFLPKLLDRGEVLAAGEEIMRRLGAGGWLDPAFPVQDGIPGPDVKSGFVPGLARDNEALEKVIFHGPMMRFYERFLGGPVLHFDYVWLRAKRPGMTDPTPPHYDVVYMGRGTKRLFTSWTVLQDVPMEKGGLMILEGSHRLDEVRRTYGELDVDTYCENRAEAPLVRSGQKQWESRVQNGIYDDDAVSLPSSLGGRWLTADFEAGDLLLFGMYTMHASTDNGSPGFRLSSDTRYQLASDPVDERWIGADPVAHGAAGKRGLIC
jgi:hypothetical protein